MDSSWLLKEVLHDTHFDKKKSAVRFYIEPSRDHPKEQPGKSFRVIVLVFNSKNV